MKIKTLIVAISQLLYLTVCSGETTFNPATASEKPDGLTLNTPKIVKSTAYKSPFDDHEAFIEFMKGSKFATPPWSDHELRSSFPKELYDSCFDPNQTLFSEVIYQSPNGLTKGWSIKTKGSKKKLPIVVFNRGGFAKWGRIVPFELLSLCRVAQQGFMVLASDFRSPKDDSKNASEIEAGKRDKTDLGYGDVNDSFYLIDAVTRANANLDANNIAVWGFSRGTTLAALMTTRSDSVRVVIMQGMVANLVEDKRREEFDEHVYPLLVDGWASLPLSEQNALLSGISPIELVTKIKGRPHFLILHGAKDSRTSAQDALHYARTLLDENHSVEFHLYPESGHVLSGSYNQYLNEVIESLNKHLSKPR